MELEAENLWVQSTRHDFYDKKKSSKNINFSCRKCFSKKVCDFQKIFFETRKFSLKINIKFFKKIEIFPTFLKKNYIDFQ